MVPREPEFSVTMKWTYNLNKATIETEDTFQSEKSLNVYERDSVRGRGEVESWYVGKAISSALPFFYVPPSKE